MVQAEPGQLVASDTGTTQIGAFALANNASDSERNTARLGLPGMVSVGSAAPTLRTECAADADTPRKFVSWSVKV